LQAEKQKRTNGGPLKAGERELVRTVIDDGESPVILRVISNEPLSAEAIEKHRKSLATMDISRPGLSVAPDWRDRYQRLQDATRECAERASSLPEAHGPIDERPRPSPAPPPSLPPPEVYVKAREPWDPPEGEKPRRTLRTWGSWWAREGVTTMRRTMGRLAEAALTGSSGEDPRQIMEDAQDPDVPALEVMARAAARSRTGALVAAARQAIANRPGRVQRILDNLD
jgi:hypothetical protein